MFEKNPTNKRKFYLANPLFLLEGEGQSNCDKEKINLKLASDTFHFFTTDGPKMITKIGFYSI